MPLLRPLVVLVPATLLLVGCPSGSDDDDSSTPSDDDDATTPTPVELEGDWEGEARGVIVYTGAGSYSCEGTATATVDDEDRATGQIACTFTVTADTCTFAFDDTPVGGGQRDTTLDDCFGDGPARYSLWAANGWLHGRVQRLEENASVELSWDLLPAK